MTLNAYAAEKRLAILAELKDGRAPTEGSYDETGLREALTKGSPQLGTTRFEPDAILLEFIFPDPNGAPQVLVVSLTPPERIVYMPVPAWVVESIWQGEISGSPHFESEALRLIEAYQAQLDPTVNAAHFHQRPRTGRE
jgi:hypothetical protein